jgi:hypothetical protein
MDVITNFHGADTIDLTGLGVSLKYDGSLSSTIRHGHKSPGDRSAVPASGHQSGRPPASRVLTDRADAVRAICSRSRGYQSACAAGDRRRH